MKRKVLLLLAGLLLFKPAFAFFDTCDPPMQQSILGCSYIESIQYALDTPPNATCSVGKVLTVNNATFTVMKGFYTALLGYNASWDQNTGLVYAKIPEPSGVYTYKWICYEEPHYVALQGDTRYKMKYVTQKVDYLTKGLEYISIYAYIALMTTFAGGLIGLGLGTWLYTLLLVLLSKAGYIALSQFVWYLVAIINTAVAIVIMAEIIKNLKYEL